MSKKMKLTLLIIAGLVIVVTAIVFAVTVLAKNHFTMKPPSESDNLLNGTPAKAMLNDQTLNIPTYLNASLGFQLGLIKEFVNEKENTFLSPLSVGIALTMAANGANGETLDSFESVLGMKLHELNTFYGSVQQRLNQSAKPTVLNVANAVFFDKSRVDVSNNYLDDCGDYFSTGFYRLDFSAPFATKNINDWVSKNTMGKIQKMIDAIDLSQIMFLANAVYFEGKWEGEFDKEYNYYDDFATPSGNVQAEYMTRSLECRYYFDSGIAVAILPYKGDEY